MILFAQVGLVISYTWVALAQSLLQLYLSRFAAGLLAGSYPLAIAMMADLVGDEDTRQQYVPLISCMMGLGWTIGPAVAGIVSAYAGSEQLAMLFCPVICLFSLVVSVLMLEETREDGNIFGKCSPEVERVRNALRSKEKTDADPDPDTVTEIPTSVWLLVLAVFFFYGGAFMLDASASVVWIVLFEWGTAELANYWTIVGLVQVISSLFLSSWLLDVIRARNTLKLAMVLAGIGIGGFSLVHVFIPHMALVLFVSVAFALGETCAAELVAELAPVNLRGECVGLIGAAYSTGCFLGSALIGGMIQSQFFRQHAEDSSYSSLGFILGGVLCFVGLFTVCRLPIGTEARQPGAESLLVKGLTLKSNMEEVCI